MREKEKEINFCTIIASFPWTVLLSTISPWSVSVQETALLCQILRINPEGQLQYFSDFFVL